MEFDKKNNAYRIIMAIIVTFLITFLVTSIGVSNYYEKTKSGMQKTLGANTTSELDLKIKYIRQYLEKTYLGEFPDDEILTEAAIKGYVDGIGDKYTQYLTKEEYQDLMTNVTGNYVGIGVYMTQDRYGNIIILFPIEGSPAEETGLKTGDIITKVNGEECSGQELNIVASKVKGEEGTKVTLEIQRDEETFETTIERRTIKIIQIKSKVIENNIGYIQILSFDDNCKKEFEEKLDELLSKNIKSLIIDVRDNGGGIVTEIQDIVDLFLPKDKTIMIEISKNSEEEIVKAKKDSKIKDNLKVIVLENENSASASEILIGALKENEIATIVGTKSFGKGVMQEIVPVSTGGALKVTIQEFKTPKGNVINKKGIEPDINIKDDLKTEEDEQLQKAIEECKK